MQCKRLQKNVVFVATKSRQLKAHQDCNHIFILKVIGKLLSETFGSVVVEVVMVLS